MRVFFAIEFDDKTRAYIKSVQSMIRENSIKGNFSHEENFHLTLRFIGEVDEKQLISLKSALNRAIEQTNPFSLSFNKLGFFSREGKKIVWLGIKNEDKSLDKLYKASKIICLVKVFKEKIGAIVPILHCREKLF